MPQVHTYIRNEDLEKWAALPNKSEFIHNALNPVGRLGIKDLPPDKQEKLLALAGEPIKTPNEADENARDAVDKFMGQLPKVIKSPKDAQKAVESTGFISKSYSARKKK